MIDPNELSLEERLEKVTSEGNHWFKNARDEYNRAERLAARVRELNADIEDFKKIVERMHNQIEDDKERFQAITDFWHTARQTGYNTSWSIGGITVAALREQTDLAKAYRKPLEFEQIGGILSQDYGDHKAGDVIMNKGGGMPVGVLYRPIFARPEHPRKKGKKA